MAPMMSAPSKKKMPEVPASVNKSQVAERTMFCVMTVAMAHRPVKDAINQNIEAWTAWTSNMVCRSRVRPLMGWKSILLRGPLVSGQAHRAPHPRHPRPGRHLRQRHVLENQPPGGDRARDKDTETDVPLDISGNKQGPRADAGQQYAADGDQVFQAEHHDLVDAQTRQRP